MSKKNWFLIIGLSSLALLFLSLVARYYYVRNRNIQIRRENEKNAQKYEEERREIEAYHRSYKEKAHEEADEMENIFIKICTLTENFQKNFIHTDKDNSLIINNKYYVGYEKNDINDDFLKTLGNFLGELNVNLKKLNEIKFDSLKRQEKIDKLETSDSKKTEMKEIINEMQEYFNKGNEDYYNIIKDANKIFFSNSENKDNSKDKDKDHNLFIIKNKELIINPEISKCFTKENWKIINDSKENMEKNLNPPSSNIQGSNVEENQKQHIPKNK